MEYAVEYTRFGIEADSPGQAVEAFVAAIRRGEVEVRVVEDRDDGGAPEDGVTYLTDAVAGSGPDADAAVEACAALLRSTIEGEVVAPGPLFGLAALAVRAAVDSGSVSAGSMAFAPEAHSRHLGMGSLICDLENASRIVR